MSERSHGLFSGRTRHLSRHHKPGKLAISALLKNFKEGDRVTVVQKGNFKDIPHPRYRGRVGVVVGKRGGAYVVEFNVSKRTVRTLIVNQRHLDRVTSAR
jgi:large subunit ribosomal protein L21e